jgi:hypothetical protein
MRISKITSSSGAHQSVNLVDDDDRPIKVFGAFFRNLGARECSPNTQQAYAHDLLRFWRFLAAKGLTRDAFGPAESLQLLEYLRTGPSARSAQRLGLTLAIPETVGPSGSSAQQQ